MKKVIGLLVVVLVLASCVNMDMVWNPTTTYNALSVVLVKVGDTYQSYASLRDGNAGNYPPDTKGVWWDQ